MPRKRPEGNSEFNFDQPNEPLFTESAEYKRAKETNAKHIMEAAAEDELKKKVYSMLSSQEQQEFDHLKTPTERREYIIRKYSKLFGTIE